MSKVPTTLAMPIVGMIDTCSGCGKHPSVCMCHASSDPIEDLARDLTNSPTKKTVKKWADECREAAKTANADTPPEPRSLYVFMLERCKQASRIGDFVKIFFWRKELPVWTKQELEMAADLLREDNFKVELAPALDCDVRVHISWE